MRIFLAVFIFFAYSMTVMDITSGHKNDFLEAVGDTHFSNSKKGLQLQELVKADKVERDKITMLYYLLSLEKNERYKEMIKIIEQHKDDALAIPEDRKLMLYSITDPNNTLLVSFLLESVKDKTISFKEYNEFVALWESELAQGRISTIGMNKSFLQLFALK